MIQILTLNFTEGQVNNLLIFLNRSTYNGLQEVQAVNEIMNILSNPIINKEDKNANANSDIPEAIKDKDIPTPAPAPAPSPKPTPKQQKS